MADSLRKRNNDHKIVKTGLAHLLMVCLDAYWINFALALRLHWTAMSLIFIPELILVFCGILIYDHFIMRKYVSHITLIFIELLLLVIALFCLREFMTFSITLWLAEL